MYKALFTDVELFAAALTERMVNVWLRNKSAPIIENVIIREITPYIVVIVYSNGNKFHLLRSAVEIRAYEKVK